MRFLGLLSPLLLLVSATTSLVAAAPSLNESFALLPQCAINCLVVAANANSCAITDEACLCSSSALLDQATWCIRDNCTALETLYSKNVTSLACNLPIRDRRQVFTTTSITLGVITGAIIIARMLYRVFLSKEGMEADDWLAFSLTLFAVSDTVLCVHGLGAHGIGRDIWTLPSVTTYRFLRFLYIMEIQYYLELALLKLTLLFFYLRIFPSASVRRLLWATVAFTGFFGVIFVLVSIFQCWPVSYYWTHWDGLHTGRCLNINAVTWSNAGISIALDVWMLAIPLSQLRHLRLHWKKKVGVSLMFCVGTFVTVVSILRLQSILNFANSINPTWEDFNVANWSTIEINVGIMCSCMPSIRLLLMYFFPKVVGSSNERNQYYHQQYNLPAKKNSPHGDPDNEIGHESDNYNDDALTDSISNDLQQEHHHDISPGRHHYCHGTARSIPLVRTSQARSTLFDGQANGGHIDIEAVPAVTVTSPRPTGLGHADGRDGGAGKHPATGTGIVYSKSYTVDYVSEYHDQARLVLDRPQLGLSPVHPPGRTFYQGTDQDSDTSREGE